MKKNIFIIVTLFLGPFLLMSCSKSKSVTPTNKLAFQLKSTNSKISFSSAFPNSSLSSSLTWESGFANITNIISDAEGKESDDGESAAESVPVITKVDLFGQNQPIGNINIAPGTYANLTVKIEIAQTTTAPALYLKGNYTNLAGVKTAIEFSLNEGNVQTNMNNQMEGENQNSDPGQIEIGATAKNLVVGSNNTASVTLYLDKLMAGITNADLDAATQTTGVIVINKTNNINIYSKIKAHLSNSSDIN